MVAQGDTTNFTTDPGLLCPRPDYSREQYPNLVREISKLAKKKGGGGVAKVFNSQLIKKKKKLK